MATFILAMVQHPDVLKKAQAEVDLVVGTHRLPDLSDKISLPYIEAIIQECLRWQPVLPVGGYHLTLTFVICRIMYYSSQLFPTSSLRMTSIGALHDGHTRFLSEDTAHLEANTFVSAGCADFRRPRMEKRGLPPGFISSQIACGHAE